MSFVGCSSVDGGISASAGLTLTSSRSGSGVSFSEGAFSATVSTMADSVGVADLTLDVLGTFNDTGTVSVVLAMRGARVSVELSIPRFLLSLLFSRFV